MNPAVFEPQKLFKVRLKRAGAVSANGFSIVDCKKGEEVSVQADTARSMVRDEIAEWCNPKDQAAVQAIVNDAKNAR